MKSAILCLALGLSPYASAIAQTCSKHSPAHTVALLELYTSEGCSSCPPADHAVSAMRAAPAGSALGIDQLVPLSLHVDYWDYIGWKDVFASRTFTERQNYLSALAGSRTVYTPEVFVAGHELRDWHGGVPAAVRRINARPAQANIDIAFGQPGAGGLPVDVSAQSAVEGQLYVALFENGITSQVKGGENSGVTLHHDYVVRQWVGPIPLVRNGTQAQAMLKRPLGLPAGIDPKQLGVAAFVQDGRGELLQALALPACGA